MLVWMQVVGGIIGLVATVVLVTRPEERRDVDPE